MSARFRVKRAKPFDPQQPYPWKMRDTTRPAFLGQYKTHEAAMRAMDNTYRREAGMPERIAISSAEVQTAMEVAS